MTLKISRAIRSTSIAAAVLAATALSASGLSAQTVYSTFGEPGDTYSGTSFQVWDLGASSFMAAGFTYTGPSGVGLGTIRFAGLDLYTGVVGTGPTPLDITFLSGSSMNGATTLESWTIPSSAANTVDQIFTLTAGGTIPLLTTGQTYWVELSTPNPGYEWGWNYNTDVVGPSTLAVLGNSTSTDGGTTWTSNSANTAPAFDVSLGGTGTIQSVTPEPATMSLMAFGLVGMVGAGMRRRKRSR